MEYIDVEWIHKKIADPVRLVSELDACRSEIRKLEFFLDGKVGFASRSQNSHGTELGIEYAVPSLAEINQSPEFNGVSISSQDFETLWSMYGPAGA